MLALYKKAMNLPQKPGIYQMLDADGEPIYVGKAKSLKARVSSYFTGAHDYKTTVMLSKVADFAVIVCASEFEALVLECSLIKQLSPRYNILLKDDKGYPFIRLDLRHVYPRFTIAAKRSDDGAMYFGPYGKRGVTRDAINAVSHALLLPTCSRKFPQDIGKERPCLNHHMGQCLAYCLKDTPKAEYDRAISQAVQVLEGKGADLSATLRLEMEEAAEEMRFELAAGLRDRIRGLEHLNTRQNVVSGAMADTDVVGYYRGAAKSAFVVLHYMDGRLVDKDYELIENPLEDTAEAVSALLKQYYLGRELYPKTVYLPCKLEDLAPLETLLSQKAGRKVHLLTPQRGEKLQLIEAAAENAKIEAERASSREEKVRGTLQWLEKALGLNKPPMRIEAVDVSNLGATDIVASLTVFSNGRPLKKDYRKFKIKSLDGQDDYNSMREVLTRRFRRYLEGDASFNQLPDLLLVDGGAAHASMAAEVIESLGLQVPVFGMVKDAKHKTRGLISPAGQEIGMEAVPQVFAFIATIQEETHRFAITYQRSLRTKHYNSALDDIPGVGETRRSALLRHFKTVKRIRSATAEELAQIVPKSTAQAIVRHFIERGEVPCESSQEQPEEEN